MWLVTERLVTIVEPVFGSCKCLLHCISLLFCFSFARWNSHNNHSPVYETFSHGRFIIQIIKREFWFSIKRECFNSLIFSFAVMIKQLKKVGQHFSFASNSG